MIQNENAESFNLKMQNGNPKLQAPQKFRTALNVNFPKHCTIHNFLELCRHLQFDYLIVPLLNPQHYEGPAIHNFQNLYLDELPDLDFSLTEDQIPLETRQNGIISEYSSSTNQGNLGDLISQEYQYSSYLSLPAMVIDFSPQADMTPYWSNGIISFLKSLLAKALKVSTHGCPGPAGNTKIWFRVGSQADWEFLQKLKSLFLRDLTFPIILQLGKNSSLDLCAHSWFKKCIAEDLIGLEIVLTDFCSVDSFIKFYLQNFCV